MSRLFVLSSLLALGACAVPASGEHDHYVVFFTEWSAQLDPAAISIVAAAADAAKANPNAAVTVQGFADQTGSPQANIDISRARAQVVADTLVADGVPAGSITRGAQGATAHPELAAQASRRVDIILTP